MYMVITPEEILTGDTAQLLKSLLRLSGSAMMRERYRGRLVIDVGTTGAGQATPVDAEKFNAYMEKLQHEWPHFAWFLKKMTRVSRVE